MSKQRQFGWLFWLSAVTWGFLFYAAFVSGALGLLFSPGELARSFRVEMSLPNIGVFAIAFALLGLFLACSIYCLRVILRSR